MLPMARKVDFSEIPMIDMSPLTNGSEKDRLALGRRMSQVCREVGFLYIVNHGIPDEDVDGMFGAAEHFFTQLPEEARREVLLTQSPSWRGYLPMDLNKGNDVRLRKNLQQSFQVWAEPQPGEAGPMVSPNQWPSAMPALRTSMLAYREKVSDLAQQIIRLLGLGLGLDEATFLPLFSDRQGMLRLLHYPPQEPDGVDGGQIGTRAHTDTGAVTILAQDRNGGLQVMNNAEEWIEVPPIKGSYVVNIGEMMKLLTDGFYRATPHRVVNRSGRQRFSVPFFADPNFDVLVTPVIRNPDPAEGPQFESSYSRDTVMTCGQILAATYDRIWPAPQVAAA
jgi:isopenicillin N synthase-like dioxygenase